MSYRESNSSSRDCYSQAQSRLSQQIKVEPKDEGCPVIEESGTVCGETNSLDVFQEFRQMYDDCLRNLEGSVNGSATLTKLAPFKKLIDDLWEQNAMLVETVEELEHEATCRVTNLQDRLNKSCQKELHCMLKTKEREMECLLNKLSEKDELLRQYCCQIEELKKDIKNKCRKYQDVLKQLKTVRNEDGSSFFDCSNQEDIGENEDIGELINIILKNAEDEKKSITQRLQNAECQLKALTTDKKKYLKERSEVKNQLQDLLVENERLLKEVTSQKKVEYEKELLKTIDALKSEKKELLEKVNSLHENIKELNNNFQETRWALTSEVAEKHDQMQDLKRCVGVLEDKLRQADMQTHFKDDIIKELRKEIKASRKSSSIENPTKLSSNASSTPPLSSLKTLISPKKNKDDELKVDIHIFPVNGTKGMKDVVGDGKPFNHQSVEVQTEPYSSNMRNVSTQHKTRVQVLPRSFGTLTVTPWSGAAGETSYPSDGLLDLQEAKKNLKGIYTDRLGFYDVVNELKERKKEGAYNAKCTKPGDMKKHQPGGFSSTFDDKQGRNEDRKSGNENEKLLSQIECLKKNLKVKMEELKCQEEFTRNLEEELTKTKMKVCVLERRSKSDMSSGSELDLKRHHMTLLCTVDTVEEILRDLLSKKTCDLANCKTSLEKEFERLRCLKIELEKAKKFSTKDSELTQPCTCSTSKLSDMPSSQCSLLHVKDIEKFKEVAITGALTLEQMREQIEVMETVSKSQVQEFSCDCDDRGATECEDKYEKLREEFNDVTFQLCRIIQKVNKKPSTQGSYFSLSSDETSFKMDETTISDSCIGADDRSKVNFDQACRKENTDKLKKISMQLEEEIQKKRNQLAEHTKELNSKGHEISKLRELIRKVCNRLKEGQCDKNKTMKQRSPTSVRGPTNNLACLFYDLQELWSVLEKSMTTASESSIKMVEDSEKLREKLGCLEKCVSNKEETLKHLQDTVKLRECQIEDLKSKVQNTESQNSKLVEDVEEKCRLIASLQEAVRKGKQLELNMELIESLRFEYCDLECRLEKYEKEILLRDQKLEELHNEITNLTTKNFALAEKLKIIDPKFKILYKTSHLFEKTVCELQAELCCKDREIDSLYEKVKELESDLEKEFKKCEIRSLEDSKCIEELNIKVKDLQNELYCAQKTSRLSETETESKIKKEQGTRETVIKSDQKSYIPSSSCQNKFHQADSKFYEKRIMELQRALEYISLEHEEEKKSIYQKLCEEKTENVKNKTLITKLNESIKRKMQTEKTLKVSLENLTEELDNLKIENKELKTEIEARKKMMCSVEKEGNSNLSELEEFICCLKYQKAELRSKNYNLKMEIERENKMRRLLECRVEELNSMIEQKMQKLNQIAENYKCTSLRLQKTYETMKEIEESLICSQNKTCDSFFHDDSSECCCLKKLLEIKTAENAKLLCQIQVLKVEIESIQSENAAEEANKDSVISQLRNETEILENTVDDLTAKIQKLCEENRKLLTELESWTEKGTAMQNEFRERQKELCGKLRATICEKNELLGSLDELQKQLEVICLENVNKEKMNRELTEENSRLKVNKDSDDGHLRNKSDKIICNLTKEVKTLHYELSKLRENYNILKEEYQAVLEQLKCAEKKKCNIDKLYAEVSNENQKLLESKALQERELCELKTQNSFLKDKLSCKGESKSTEDKKISDKTKELNMKLKTLEKTVIPQLEEDLAEKTCSIENLKMELKEANISNQRMRNEALRVIEHTRKYLAAQRFANENLKSRLECSNKRGNMLGIENRELEEQLKAVTRMNEFLLCQLESGKNNFGDTEPRSFSPLPWGCPTVERDTSSSEYLAESGFQSMQPSPTIMDCDHDSQCDSKRSYQWNSLKKNKCGGSVDFTSYRNNLR